jgi:histidine kinase
MIQENGYNVPSGFIAERRMHKNERHDILVAVRLSDNLKVTLKNSRPLKDNINEISKLSHEFNVLKDLDHPAIIKVYSLLSHGKSLCLVEEYFEGEPLKSRIYRKPFSINEFFQIAGQLTDVLGYLESQGIVHKDINPGNILISEDNQIKLIDFGISTSLHNEENEMLIPDLIEGTLVYISPEQTGRTSFSISPSSDIYSLGIVFYEMLAGKPPFDSADPLEVIHFHLSRTPLPIGKIIPGFQEGLDKTISVMLEKNPDDRYHSVSGLKYDLITLAGVVRKGESTASFVPRSMDRSGRFTKTQRLYGRENEIAKLIRWYEELTQKKSMLVLVAGYSGVGKSAVIKQIQQPITQKRGIFLLGKFDQFKRNIPYFAFIEAFEEIIKSILAESDDKIQHWNKKITRILGINAALITEVIPRLELIIGKQAPVQKLQPAEQEFRFRMVLLDFIYIFSEPGIPLVIFLDDLQWADLPSLNLIERIMTNPRNSEIMVLGAYRNNEVDEAHPLKLTINQAKKAGTPVQEILLQPLDLPTTVQIVADSFGMNISEAGNLGKHVFLKTKGNPFFINRFLKSLYENGYVTFSNEQGWTWDKNVLESLDFTDNVIDLMAREMANLPVSARDGLKIGALLGNTFDLATLGTIMGKSQHEIFQQLFPALKAGYLLPVDKYYRSLSLSQQGLEESFLEESEKLSPSFRFLHDRVQQAAYALIADNEKDLTHLETGRILLADISDEKLSETVFEIAGHFARCINLLIDSNEKIQVAKVFLLAGTKAKDSTSYDVAVKYLTLAYNLLPPTCWDDHYHLSFQIFSELGECEYLNSNHKKAEYLFEQILLHAKTNLEKLNTYYIHSSLYLKIGNNVRALEIGREAMLLYKIRFPSGKLAIKVQALWEIAKYLILFSTKYRNIENLYDLKDCNDEEIIAINKFLIDIATSAYQQNQELMVIVVLRIIRFYLKHGYTDASSWGLSGFSVIVYSGLGMFERGSNLWELTIRLHQKTKSQLIKRKLDYTVNAFYTQWKRPLKEGIENIIDNYKACLLNGDPNFAGYNISMYIWKKAGTGIPLNQVFEAIQPHINYLNNNKNEGGYFFSISKYQALKAFGGKTPQLGNWNDEDFSGEEFLTTLKSLGNNTSLAYYYCSKLPLLFLFGHYREALDWADEGEIYIDNLLGSFQVAEWRFFYALSISANYDKMTSTEKRKYNKIFKKQLEWTRFWSKGCPDNFQHYLYILLGEQKAMSGKNTAALGFFEKAIDTAANYGYINIEALANERSALLMAKMELYRQSKAYLREAWELYSKWDATGKCKELEMRHPAVLKEMHRNHLNTLELSLVGNTARSTTESLDLNSIVKASQSLASQIKLEDLLQNLMYILIENAGAQRGVLILNRDGKLSFVAEGNSGPERSKILNNLPLDQENLVPLSVIQYCWNSQEMIAVANASIDELFSKDPYIHSKNTLSVFCFPISNKGNKLGMIYLENNLMEGVFTDKKQKVIDLLSGQIGISLENAMLYENMEEKVKQRTLELETQKELAEEQRKKSDDLLLNILPLEVAEELKEKGRSDAKLYQNVTVLFSDFVNFTSISENLSPQELVQELHHCFKAFDEITEKHGLEKIKTIGDAYLAVSGLPVEHDGHAINAAKAALDIINWINDPTNKSKFKIRIGLNSGPVVAGIVGVKKYVYDIWGDTVNTAARLEENSEPGKINISGITHEAIKHEFPCKFRGKINAKNKGEIEMYFISDSEF